MPYPAVKGIHVACGRLAVRPIMGRVAAMGRLVPGRLATFLTRAGWAAWICPGTTALWLTQLTRQHPVQHGGLSAKVATLAALRVTTGRALGRRRCHEASAWASPCSCRPSS